MLTGLIAGVISGKASLKVSDNPQFNEAFIATICFNPSSVKWFLFLTMSNACLKNI